MKPRNTIKTTTITRRNTRVAAINQPFWRTAVFWQVLFRVCLRRGVVVFWWMRWKDFGCGSLHERHISFDLSYIILPRFCSGELHFLLLIVFFWNNTDCYTLLSDGKHNNNNNNNNNTAAVEQAPICVALLFPTCHFNTCVRVYCLLSACPSEWWWSVKGSSRFWSG